MVLSPTQILLNILGGVALLVWGTRMVQNGFTKIFGADVRRWVSVGIGNPYTAAGVGLGVTGVLQSSTATALITISFIRQGLLATAPALGMMLGADVGTTLVVQVFSFDLSWLSPLLVLGGVIAYLSGKSTARQNAASAVIGLGLLLLALRLIGMASEPLRDGRILQQMFQSLEGDWLVLVLFGALATWAAHSSLAMVLLVVSLTTAQVLDIQHGLLLVLGANLGGVIPHLTMTFNATPDVRRVPLGNLIFKISGVVVAVPLLSWIAPLLVQFESSPARQIADFHTAFNLALMLVFIWFTGPMARLLTRMMPDLPNGEDSFQPRYLDPSALETPAVAMAYAARETLRMGEVVERMLTKTIEVLETDEPRLMAEIAGMDDVVDRLYQDIKLYVTEVTREPLTDEDSRRGMEILSFIINLEHIGDIIDKNLMELANKKITGKLQFSREGKREIRKLHDRLTENFQLACGVFLSREVSLARRLLTEKIHYRDLERIAAEAHLDRLRTRKLVSIDTSSIHLDVLNEFKRINSHITSVAYQILDDAGELFTSRLKPSP